MANVQACRGDSEEPEPHSVREAVFVAIREKNYTGFALKCLRTDRGAEDSNDKALHRQELPGNAV